MKRRLMLAAMSLILTVTLSVTSMNTVAEASPKMSPTEENLEITINSFLESDGAVAEELTDEMLKTFLETPLDFLRVIDTYPLDKQELLLSRIANVAVGMPDEERLSFEDIIYSADETTPGRPAQRWARKFTASAFTSPLQSSSPMCLCLCAAASSNGPTLRFHRLFIFHLVQKERPGTLRCRAFQQIIQLF